MKPHLILQRLGCLCLSLGFAATFAVAHEKPNFVIINVDDLGYADIGPYGSDNKTPHLDRMAREGRKLTSHYAAPVCSPSRASLMTGCYPKRVLPIPHVLFPGAEVGLNPKEVTVAEVLKDVGYKTACFGKWHLGDQLEFLPTSQGFDEYFGIPYSNDMGFASEGARSNFGEPLPPVRTTNNKNAKPAGGVSETGITGNLQPPLPLLENEKVVERVRAPEQATVTRRYTERAVRFIKEHQNESFFVYMPHNAVHFPLYPSEAFRGKSPNGLIGDWAEEVDWSVGQVLDTLRELGLDRKTLVLFTSDNGGALNHGSKNTPLRGAKGQTYEGGIRVCTVAWWPGKIPAGTSTAAITSMMDVLPTFASLAGAKVPADRKIDGLDVWPVLNGESDKGPREEFLYFRGFQLEAVRKGPWKLRLDKPELYNLEKDISETTNLFGENAAVVDELTSIARLVEHDLGINDKGPNCRELGRVPNPQPLIGKDGHVRADAASQPGAMLE
jgi:arylsulfatase A